MSARNDLISGILLLVVTAVFYAAATAIEEDPFSSGMQPYVLPKAVCGLIGGMTVLFVAGAAWRLRRQSAGDWDLTEVKLFISWVLPMAFIAFAYIALLDLFQYPIPTVVCLSATLALFGNRGVHWLVTAPVVVSLLYYIVFFGIFRLLEPRGRILEYDNYDLFGPLRNVLGI
jgi:hypothetical protein